MERPESCIKLAGGSPATVSAVAPCSRPRAAGEILSSEWGVESPPVAVWLPGGEQVRRPSIMRTLQPRDINTRKVGLAEPLMSRRRQQTASGIGAMQGARGVWRRACGHSLMRNRRDPSRRPASGEGGPYKPTAKGDRAGRESEGLIVPLTPVANAGRGKGPCFGLRRRMEVSVRAWSQDPTTPRQSAITPASPVTRRASVVGSVAFVHGLPGSDRVTTWRRRERGTSNRRRACCV